MAEEENVSKRRRIIVEEDEEDGSFLNAQDGEFYHFFYLII